MSTDLKTPELLVAVNDHVTTMLERLKDLRIDVKKKLNAVEIDIENWSQYNQCWHDNSEVVEHSLGGEFAIFYFRCSDCNLLLRV